MAIRGGTVAFAGEALDFAGPAGVFTSSAPGGPLTTIADKNTLIPDGGGATFDDFVFGPGINADGTVVFRGDGPGFQQSGVYRSDGGTLSTVVDTDTPFPGGAAGATVGEVRFPTVDDAGNVAFLADGGGFNAPDDIFLAPAGGGLQKLTQVGDPIPGATGGETFGSFGVPSISDGAVAFTGGQAPGGGNASGVYMVENGRLTAVADTSGAGRSTDADGNPFVAIRGNVSLAEDDLAFMGLTGTSAADARESLFLSRGGELTRVIGSGDTLDGKTLADFTGVSVLMGEGGFDGSDLAFLGFFEDGSQGLFLANVDAPAAVPEPGTTALLGLAAVVGLLLRRRRR